MNEIEIEVQCPVCKQWFEAYRVHKRWGYQCRDSIMCDHCADHYVEQHGEPEETEADDE